jgi:hypothetical protein
MDESFVTRMRNHHIAIAGIGILWIVIDKYMFMKKKIKEKNEKIASLNKSSMENFQRTKEFVSLTNKYYLKIKEHEEEIKELNEVIECYETALSKNRRIENRKEVLYLS